MVKRQTGPSVTAGPEGVHLTPFADEICLQEDLEVSLVSLPVTVQDISFPMCLGGKRWTAQGGAPAHRRYPCLASPPGAACSDAV